MAIRFRYHRRKSPAPVQPDAAAEPETSQFPAENETPQPAEPEPPHTPGDRCTPHPKGGNGTASIIVPDERRTPETAHHTPPEPQDEDENEIENEIEAEPASEPENEPETETEPENEPEPEAEPGTRPAENPLLRHREQFDLRPDAPFYATLRQAAAPGSDPQARSEALDKLETLVRIARLIDRISPRQPESESGNGDHGLDSNPENNTESGNQPPRLPYLVREYRRIQQPEA